jgi:hypothetical protein
MGMTSFSTIWLWTSAVWWGRWYLQGCQGFLKHLQVCFVHSTLDCNNMTQVNAVETENNMIRSCWVGNVPNWSWSNCWPILSLKYPQVAVKMIVNWNDWNTVLITKLCHSRTKEQLCRRIKLSLQVIISFTCCSFFQWYPQIKEILLNLSMKCWNWAFSAQGSRIIRVSCTGRSTENICSSSGGDETQFTTKIGGKTSLGPSYFVL